jgi:hypothetical protein
MNWLKKLVKNHKQNIGKQQFENELQQACQYEIFELGD